MKKLFALVLCMFAASAFAADPKTEKEIQASLNSWKQAMLNRDKAVFEKLYAPDLTYTHSSGKQENKTEAIDAVVRGKTRYDAVDITDTAIRSYGNAAVAKCKVTIKMTTDGTPSTVNLDILHVFIKNGGRWQLVARQAVRLNP